MSGARQYGIVRYGMSATGELPLACLLLDGHPKTYCVCSKLLMALSSQGIVDEAEQMNFIKQHLADCQMIPRFRLGMRVGPHFSPFRYEFELRHSNGTSVKVEGLPNLREALQKTVVPEWKARQPTHTPSSPTVAVAQSDGPAATVKRRRLSASAVAPATPGRKQSRTAASAAAGAIAAGHTEGEAASQPGLSVPLRRSARRGSAAAAALPPPEEQRSASAAGTAVAGATAACGPGEQAPRPISETVTRRSSSSSAAAALPTVQAPAVAAAQPVAVLPLAGAVSASAALSPPPAAAAVRTVGASKLPVVPHHALQITPLQYDTLVQALGTSLDAAASATAAALSEQSSKSASSEDMIMAASNNPKLYESAAFLQAVNLVAQKEMAQAEMGKQVLDLCHKILLWSRGPGSAPITADTALAAAFCS